MSETVSIRDMLNLAISMEVEGAKIYKSLADKAENSKDNLFYKPHVDRVVWNEEKGFYKELEEKALGLGAADYYHRGMSPKVTKGEYIGFYQSIGDIVTDGVKSILNDMAEDEARHSVIFKKWLEEIDDDKCAFSLEAADYFKKHSGQLKFNKDIPIPESILEALAEGLETEQGAMDFYTGMLQYANSEARDILEKIIYDEKEHKARLESQVEKYKLFTKDKTVVHY